MAGSHAVRTHPGFSDPVLSARLEALQLLADQVSERIMVVDKDFTILYANRSAWPGAETPNPVTRPAKCYEAFLDRSDPCDRCPAMEVFHSGELRTVACSAGKEGTTCGMVQAFPLLSAEGRPTCALVLLNRSGEALPAETPFPNRAADSSESLPAEATGLGDLVGQSAVMRRLFEMIRLVADSQATVLLHGESGTGKELVARSIHSLSSRRRQPFVVLDCGSLPESLLESELFGHVRGAFTGAHFSRKGLFEEANGGTIFLDEIADTSLNFQSKLLRVLQEGQIKPVGSSRSVSVDVRVISATNKDLFDLVKAKRFREDLYYRLAVLPLALPPLRERVEDIPSLVQHFVGATSRRHRKPPRPVNPEALRALMQAPWPGNVRELEHLVERAMVTTIGPDLTPEHFFGPSDGPVPDSDLRSVARQAAGHAERQKIVEALHASGGKKASAARALKISRANLYNKLREYGIR